MERALPHVARRGAIVLALANQKGGVGKTTSAVNLSVVLAAAGYRVLLIDNDPQGNATSSLGIEKQELDRTMYDVLAEGASLSGVTVETGRDRLALIPSTPALAGAEVELVNLDARESRLRSAIQQVRGDYDLILIDCPPSLGLITVNALTAADLVVVPIQCEFLALEGVGQLITTIDLVRRQLNRSLDIIGVLMTMFDGRTRLSQHVVNEVRTYFPERIFEAVIPRSVRLAEAPSYGQSIVEYDRSSRGAKAYRSVAEELLGRLDLPPNGVERRDGETDQERGEPLLVGAPQSSSEDASQEGAAS
jgi:chromosome partitioning protein